MTKAEIPPGSEEWEKYFHLLSFSVPFRHMALSAYDEDESRIKQLRAEHYRCVSFDIADEHANAASDCVAAICRERKEKRPSRQLMKSFNVDGLAHSRAKTAALDQAAAWKAEGEKR